MASMTPASTSTSVRGLFPSKGLYPKVGLHPGSGATVAAVATSGTMTPA